LVDEGTPVASTQHTVWAMAHLSKDSEGAVRALLREKLGIPSSMIKRGLHTTVYHARRPLHGLGDGEEPLSITVPGSELRMMALAPGGENARPDIDPRLCLVGLRIRRANGAADGLETVRARFFAHETPHVLGTRRPSTRRTSAFGARSYQPHLTILKPGAVSDPDLSKIGAAVREHLDCLHFDRLVIRCRAG
jgi:hypothetical protein